MRWRNRKPGDLMARKFSASNISNVLAKDPKASDFVKLESSLKGYSDFKKQLKAFDPALKRAMDQEIRKYLKPVITDARSMVPDVALSGWRLGPGRGATNASGALPNYDVAAIRKGIVIRQGQAKRRRPGEAVVSAWELRNNDGAGSAFEGAGRKGGRSAGGKRFISALTLYHGKFPRLLWRAWGQAGGDQRITADVIGIVRAYESKLELGLKAAKG